MTPFYNTQQKTQAQNNVQAHIFGIENVETAPKDLNYFEKNRLIKFSIFRKFKGQGQCVLAVFDYLVSHANNKTGISYHSQARMEDCLGFSKRQIIRAIKLLEAEGYIYKGRRGRNVTNAYIINFDLINNPDAMHGIKPSALKSYPRKPRKTWSIPEVTSSVTLTTNTEVFLKEVSINTNIENTNFLDKQSFEKEEIATSPIETVFETTEPIPLTNDLQFRKITLDSIGKKTQLIGARYFDAIERWEEAYRYKWKDPSIRRTIDHWNADFNKYCQYQKHWEDQKGSRMIPPIRRIMYNEKKLAEPKIETPKPFAPTEEWKQEDNLWRIKMGLQPRY